MHQKSAPDTAKLPPVNREMVSQWESELDDFVADIQLRLSAVATSISRPVQPTPAANEPASHQSDAVTVDSVSDDVVLDAPVNAPVLASRDSEPTLIDVPSTPPVSVAQQWAPEEAAPAGNDETGDRLQAIKMKIAARLQGDVQ